MESMVQKTINTLRFLSVDAVQNANSGHPGLPLGAAPMAYTLWSDFLKATSKDSKWIDRDRFVLSAGHGSALLYSLLHVFGYDLPIEELKNFRQWDSKTPGHPEFGHTDGVETTTGPLGQGIANAVGMAIAETRLAAEFNKEDIRVIDHYTYAVVGDGDLMEGLSSEAASLAGHLGLGKLICLYDDNSITIDGKTEITFTENVEERFKSFGWQTIRVDDGNDVEKIKEAISKARDSAKKPSLILAKTTIGYGSPNKAGTSSVHGAPLGKEEVELTRKNLGWDYPPFEIPQDVKDHMLEIRRKKAAAYDQWVELMESYKEKYEEDYKRLRSWVSGEYNKELLEDDRLWNFEKDSEATRASGGRSLNIIKEYIQNVIGGSADLNESTKTYLKGCGNFSKDNRRADNIFYGVREHAMGSIANGIAVHGGFKTFTATFLVFSDYMRPSIRLAALMKIPVVFIFTHDSIALGEDGPTHQPVEHVMSLRLIPGLNVYRPADAKETSAVLVDSFERNDGPSVVVLSRQNLPLIEGAGRGVHMGAYVVKKEKDEEIDVLIMASGSELKVGVDVAQKMEKEYDMSVRVVSMPCMEVFESMSKSYRDSVIPPHVKRKVSIEAGVTKGWEKYTGDGGICIGVDGFGMSAPGGTVYREYGFDTDKIIRMIKEMK